MPTSSDAPPLYYRLQSLDFMRGFIMVLLALESAGLYDYIDEATKGSAANGFIRQFFHHPWHGLHFWDLVQPAFMFMAGIALAYSLHRQKREGLPWRSCFLKTLKRCGWLFFWGVLDYAVRDGNVYFLYWDVLTQLAFTTLLAFLIFEWAYTAQIGVCFALLLLTEGSYRFTHVPNFNQPFVDQHNFGNYIDLRLMNTINDDGWVTINCIPTAVHTIAGAVTGKLLLSKENKLKPIIICVFLCLVAGYALDWSNITPIIKRIATSSFVLVSLGWVLLMLALFYWWIDVRTHAKCPLFFLVIGMNSLFIYLFFEIAGHRWFTEYITTIVTSLLSYLQTPHLFNLLVASLVVFLLEWGLCYWLYKKKIFFKI